MAEQGGGRAETWPGGRAAPGRREIFWPVRWSRAGRGGVAHPVLHHPAWNAAIAGWVEAREVRPRTDRIVLKVSRIEGGRLDQVPERVRVSVAKGTAPPVGGFIELKARLEPPRAPLRPG